MSRLITEIRIGLPDWVGSFVDDRRTYAADEERMRMVIALSRENVLRGTGGPFGAAIFEEGSSRLLAVGVNTVERLINSALHAEVMAIMLAEARAASYSLRAPGLPAHALFTSCDPCAMCLGAALWSGVHRIVCAAGREDAARIGFDEGPVLPESYRYLEDRGITIILGLLREEARAVLDLYRDRGGRIYNA